MSRKHRLKNCFFGSKIKREKTANDFKFGPANNVKLYTLSVSKKLQCNIIWVEYNYNIPHAVLQFKFSEHEIPSDLLMCNIHYTIKELKLIHFTNKNGFPSNALSDYW